MIFYIFKNMEKTQKQHPDFIIKDEKFNNIGIGYNNKSKQGTRYIKVTIK